MAQTESEFHTILKLLMEHYLKKKITKKEMLLFTLFFNYFMKKWGPGSHVQNWYARLTRSLWLATRDWRTHTRPSRRTTPSDLSGPWASLQVGQN